MRQNSDGTLQAVSEPIFADSAYDGALWSYDFEPYEHLDVSKSERPHDRIRIPLDTLVPEIAQRRAFSPVQVPGDRWVFQRELNANRHGGLLIRDGETLEVRLIDTHVYHQLMRSDPEALDSRWWQTDTITYAVRKRDDSRTGLWRVRFAD